MNKLLIFSFIALLMPLMAFGGNFQAVTIEGQIFNESTGLALSGSNVTFTASVYSPGSPKCLLWKETHAVNMSQSEGLFKFILGSGTKVAGVTTFIQVFDNSAGALSSLSCDSGSSYTATATDDRLIKIEFNDNSGSGTVALSEQSIKSVPFAMYAEKAGEAIKIGGATLNLGTLANGDVLVYNNSTGKWENQTLSGGGTISGVTAGTGLTGGGTSGSVSLAVDAGTSANKILQLDGSAKIPAVDGSQVTNLNPTNLSTAVPLSKGGTGASTQAGAANAVLPSQTGNSGKYLVTDGSNVSWSTVSAGVTSVGVSVPSFMTSTGGPITSSGTIALTVNSQTARTVLAAPTAAAGTPTFRTLDINDIKSTVAGSWMTASGACPSGQQLTYLSASDTLSCQAYSITSTQITTALGYTPADSANLASYLPLAGGTMTGSLGLANLSVDPSGLSAGDKGKTWFNSTSNQIKYWDGSAIQTLGVSGAGLTNLNGQTGSTQGLAIGSTGTAPSWGSAANTHTLNIPMAAAAGVTAGLLSKSDYDTFNNKLSATITTPSIGQYLRYNGSTWVNNSASISDITGATPGGIIYGGASTLASSSAGVTGQPLVSNGALAPTWSNSINFSAAGTINSSAGLTLGNSVIFPGNGKWTSTGKLGIGTVSPTTELNVHSTSSTGPTLSISTPGTVSGQQAMLNFNTSSTKFWQFYANGDATTSPNDFGLAYFNGATWYNPLYINSVGMVGVGTVSPATQLHVYEASGTYPLKVETNNSIAGIQIVRAGGVTGSISMAASNTMTIDSGAANGIIKFPNGNVGIGTASPSVSLDISGKTDAIRLPAGTTAQRPTATGGALRYNTTTARYESVHNGAWTISALQPVVGKFSLTNQTAALSYQDIYTPAVDGFYNIMCHLSVANVTFTGSISVNLYFTAGNQSALYESYMDHFIGNVGQYSWGKNQAGIFAKGGKPIAIRTTFNSVSGGTPNYDIHCRILAIDE